MTQEATIFAFVIAYIELSVAICIYVCEKKDIEEALNEAKKSDPFNITAVVFLITAATPIFAAVYLLGKVTKAKQ